MWIVISNLLGFLLDLCLGDPIWIKHPVVLIGKAISNSEKMLRKLFPKNAKSELIAGLILAISIPVLSFLVSSIILYFAYKINFILFFIIHTFWAYQILATRCLEQESRKVFYALQENLEQARKQIARIVGRETSNLNSEEIIKACVETVAENTSDGVIAPLCYLMLGGVPLGFFYKAINTLDSMAGYRNKKYQYFGTASAKLDDIANFLPSRICAIFMIISAKLLNFNFKSAYKIFLRDRNNHLSPNSAQTESVIAGALGIQLGGTHVYFGELVEKQTIGDNLRHAEPEDILKANQLLMLTAILAFIIFSILKLVFIFL
ncbi:MAG: adenosylcobinamide-phosphate synthase CbiB [Oscillospiraceae bacterium]|nr:adenosylcobinamide-phosphate synthase CbiB [Oscillospiraceae bacterium]